MRETIGIALWGLHLGLTQGILASLITDTAPPPYRGTAFGVFNFASGLGLLIASAGAGALWEVISPVATFAAGAVAALLSERLGASLTPESREQAASDGMRMIRENSNCCFGGR